MRISARGEYAVRAVLDLTLHRDRRLTPIQDIAARQAIPQRYLEQVLLALKRAGLVGAKRGSAGGYHLTRPPGLLTVGEVLRAVEGPGPAAGTARGNGHGADLGGLWAEIDHAVRGVVDHLTFEELAERVRARREAAAPMYHI